MSDIKFSCPQCGQHIAAATSWASRQVPCPKCQAVLTVPGNTATAPPSLPPVLPPAAAPAPGPLPMATAPRQAKGSSAWIWIIAGVGVVGLAVVALVVFLGVKFYRTAAKELETQRRVVSTPPDSPGPPVKVEPRERREKDPPVEADPAGAEIPDAPVSGIVRGQPFNLEAATANRTMIVLKQGKDFFPDASLTIFPFLKQGETLEGRKIIVTPGKGTGIRPHIHVARKLDPNGPPKTEIVAVNYSMRLEFGERRGDKLPGRIYLELGERFGTKVAGTFEVKVSP